MTGGIYDHLVAVVLFGVIFGAAAVALPNVGYVSLLSVDQQQLRNVALSALNTILLDAGYPINWGSGASFNPASVVRFGLASANDSALYNLDMDKVMHLVEKDEFGEPNPMGYLPPDTMRQLLGLQGYGFNLKILAPFNVTVRDLAPPANPSDPTEQELKTINYEVVVKYNDGKPIPNAVVNASIFYSGESNPIQNIKETRTTNALGKCSLAKSLSGQVSDVIIVFEVTVGDIHTATSVYRRGNPHDDIANINIVGDTINLTVPPDVENANRWVISIDAYTEEGFVHLYNGTKGREQDMFNWGNGKYDEWFKAFPGLKYMNPLILIFNFWAVPKQQGGRQSVIVVGPFPGYLGNRVLSYGSGEGPPSGAASVALQRVVRIAGMTYDVEFTLWKQ